jgi:hypothetical protein
MVFPTRRACQHCHGAAGDLHPSRHSPDGPSGPVRLPAPRHYRSGEWRRPLMALGDGYLHQLADSFTLFAHRTGPVRGRG